MKQKISLAVAGLLLSTSAFALEGAYGALEGTLGLRGILIKPKDKTEKDFGTGNAHLRLAYTTPSFAGFSAKVEGIGNAKLYEKEKKQYDRLFQNKALLTQGYLQFAIKDAISIKTGRYKSDLEWFRYYNQGAIAEISLPYTLVSIGYSNKNSESHINKSEDFHKPFFDDDSTIKAKKGVYLIDIQNESLGIVKFNPYYYQMPDYGRFFGLKLDFDEKYFDLALQYAKSKYNNKIVQDGDGSIATIETALKITEKDRLFAGYIKADKKYGAKLITSFGKKNPFEDGDYLYDPNAKTWYVGANVTDNRSIVTYGALYGNTTYDDIGSHKSLKNKELNLSVDFNITKALDIGFMFVLDDNHNNGDNLDYKKYLLGVWYNF